MADVDAAVGALSANAASWAAAGHARREQLLRACLAALARLSRDWVDAAGADKRIEPDSAAAADEIGAGPTTCARLLQMLIARERVLASGGADPYAAVGRLPRPPRLADRILFAGLTAEGIAGSPIAGVDPGVCTVLGAGNSSGLPYGDTLDRLFVHQQVVLLKPSPLMRELAPVLEAALAPLIGAGVVRVVTGDSSVGRDAARHAGVTSVHVTGAPATFEALRSDPAIRQKSLSAELGNVTPVLIAPGRWRAREIDWQAEHLAACIVHNASCNCVTPRVLLTWNRWPQREAFVARLREHLAVIPPRRAFYDSAPVLWAELTGRDAPDDGRLPWTLIADARPESCPLAFARENFTPVVVEHAIDAPDPIAFLRRAAELANERLAGDLAAHLIAPAAFRRAHPSACDEVVRELRYGAVGVNQWAGLCFALGLPWGSGGAGKSGRGQLRRSPGAPAVKVVLRGPFRSWPKPPWFAAHRRPVPVMWAFCDFYLAPRPSRLMRVGWHGLRG